MKKHKILLWLGIILLNLMMWLHFNNYIKPINPNYIIKDSLRIDTIVLSDTLTITNLKPVYTTKIRNETIRVSEPVTDIEIPIEEKKYTGDTLFDNGKINFSAVISGYKPVLDSLNFNLETYNTHSEHTEFVQIPIEKKEKRWNIGLQAGYGFGFSSKRFEPYLGVGVTYRIF